MSFDIKTFTMGSLTGLTFGLGIADLVDKDLSEIMSGMGSILAAIGALFTAYIAFMVYKRWYQQHDYAESQRLISELENINLKFFELMTKNISVLYSKKLDEDFKVYQSRFMMASMGLVNNFERKFERLLYLLPNPHPILVEEVKKQIKECDQSLSGIFKMTNDILVHGTEYTLSEIHKESEASMLKLDIAVHLLMEDAVYLFKI